MLAVTDGVVPHQYAREGSSNPNLAVSNEGQAYTNGSLTATTNTLPAFFNDLWLIYPGTWELEQEGPISV
jgi:hypothetical protein